MYTDIMVNIFKTRMSVCVSTVTIGAFLNKPINTLQKFVSKVCAEAQHAFND